MALEPLKINKRWTQGNQNEEADWDAIRDPLIGWALRTNQNLKQLGLDINGSTYDFNNVGRATQTASIVGRLDALELSRSTVGTQNIALDLTGQTIVKITAADNTDLSASNIGYATFTDTGDAGGAGAGELLTRTITANQSVTLTGASWGLPADVADVPLWVYLIDTGSAVVLGVSVEGSKRFAASSDAKTAVGDVTASTHILCASAVGGDSNLIELGVIYGDFDLAGGSSEKLWTLQRAVGDIHYGPAGYVKSGVFYF